MISLRRAARSARALLSRTLSPDVLKIGVSPRIFHPQPDARGLQSKTLQYLEQSVAHWVMSRDVLVFMVPTVDKDGLLHRSNIRVADYARVLDGLVLQGGADVSPATYGQQPLRPEWAGDPVRDRYEIELLDGFLSKGKPVLGICRGCQLINVAFGGTLFQDIGTQQPDAHAHVDADLYDQHKHDIAFEPGSKLAGLYPEATTARVNSIHHQAVDRLGSDLTIEARSLEDGMVEAIRARGSLFVAGVQWHPEFHFQDAELLSGEPLLDAFLSAARAATEAQPAPVKLPLVAKRS